MTDPWGPPTAFDPAVGGPPAAGAPPRRPWQSVLRSELGVVAALLAGGLVLGGVWALLAPGLADAADPGESRVAVDGLLALLQLGAGLVVAVALVLVPGREPVARVVTVLAGSAAAGGLAAVVGLARGLHLQAPGSALVWPLVVAVLTAVRMLVGLQLTRDGRGRGRRRRGVSD